MTGPGALELAQALIRLDTSGAREEQGVELVSALLGDAGFDLALVPWEPSRPNLVARWRGGGAVTLAAHLDTVPFDASTWSVDPLGGDVVDGRLYGRGSSDMKAGAAAMVRAALDAAAGGAEPFTLVFTSAEETGCGGARAVAAAGLLDPSPILIVGEATGNDVFFGHKGATWLELEVTGRSAHGSRPELGDNAVYRLVDAIAAVRDRPAATPHPVLGSLTTSVGTVFGGQQTNLVPDRAALTMDVRTVPGQDARPIADALRTASGGTVREILDVPSVWTDPSSALSRRVTGIVEGVTGAVPMGGAVSYFTDGAVLADRAAPAVYIIGPGDIDQPHTSDEWCDVERIAQATDIYRALLVAGLADRGGAGP